MQPIGPLMVEHRWIERVLADVESRLADTAGLRGIDSRYVDTVVDFIRTYADRCHHGKEEDLLFRALSTRPLSPELLATMKRLVADHEWARAKTRALVAANALFAEGDPAAEAEVRQTLGELAAFYPRHIALEDDHFFRPVMTYFSPEERQEMLAAFTAFDATLIHERYRRIVDELRGASTS